MWDLANLTLVNLLSWQWLGDLFRWLGARFRSSSSEALGGNWDRKWSTELFGIERQGQVTQQLIFFGLKRPESSARENSRKLDRFEAIWTILAQLKQFGSILISCPESVPIQSELRTIGGPVLEHCEGSDFNSSLERRAWAVYSTSLAVSLKNLQSKPFWIEVTVLFGNPFEMYTKILDNVIVCKSWLSEIVGTHCWANTMLWSWRGCWFVQCEIMVCIFLSSLVYISSRGIRSKASGSHFDCHFSTWQNPDRFLCAGAQRFMFILKRKILDTL